MKDQTAGDALRDGIYTEHSTDSFECRLNHHDLSHSVFQSMKAEAQKWRSEARPGESPNRTDLLNDISGRADLDDKTKQRFMSTLREFDSRSDVSAPAKEACFANIKRILDDKSEAPFTVPEKAKLAENLAWNLANPEEDAQGFHNTCNVTDVRICLERSDPATFSKLIADVVTTGSFVTASMDKITPPVDSLRAGAEERIYPPEDGKRTWIGQISDVTMANIHWQRAHVDNFGNPVPVGSMQYEQTKPTTQSDTGERIYKYETRSDGQYRTQLAAGKPELWPGDVNGIYHEITGRDETGRYVVHNSRRAGNGVVQVDTVSDLEKQFSKGPWPKILELEDHVLQNFPDGGRDHEHVVVALGYNPTTRKVQIDNSHEVREDMIDPARQADIQTVFNAMKAPNVVVNGDNSNSAPIVEKYDEQKQRWVPYKDAPAKSPQDKPADDTTKFGNRALG